MFDIFGGKDPQKALQRANEYIKEDKIGSAIKTLEENLTESEESFDLYILLAKLYFEVEERGRAVDVLRQIKSIIPARVDEIIAALSDLYYRHPTIDSADFLLQLHIEQHRYDESSKVLRNLTERDISLLITRYDKIKQNIDSKKVVSKKDFEKLLILTTLRFYINESEKAIESIEPMIDEDVHARQLLNWIRVIARERYTDPFAMILLMKILIANNDFEGALSQAQRIAEKFPDSLDALIAIASAAKPPKDLEPAYTQFVTDLYIKKGDLDASIDMLLDTLKHDIKKADDVIKGLRELDRINPGNAKILYALGNTYMTANRTSLAVSEFSKILEIDLSQYKRIIEKLKEGFQKEPNNPQVIEGLVNAYLLKNNLDSAVDVIEQAYDADPGLIDEYIVNLNSILEKNINHTKALYLLGRCYADKGDRDNAVVILESLMDAEAYQYILDATKELCADYPDEIDYVNLRARSMIALGQEKKALSLLETYLKNNPEKMTPLIGTLDGIANAQPAFSSKILHFLKQYKIEDPFIGELFKARVYAFADNYDKAVPMFENLMAQEEYKESVRKALIEVIQARPKAVPLLLAAARIFMKIGEVEIATRFFKTAQMVDPKAFFEIIDEFYDALKAFPKDREVRTLLVDTFFSRKLWERVVEECKNAIEVFGREEQFFNLRLGQALVEQGNLSDAVRPLMLSLDGSADCTKEVLKYLDNILNIDKSNVPAHFARGRALSRAKHIDEAVEEYLLTVRILPARAEYVYEELKTLTSKSMANPLIIFAMGTVEFVLKKYDDAIKHLLQASELDASLVKRVIPQYEKLEESSSSPLLDFSLAKAYHIAGLKSSAVKYYMKAQGIDKKYREPAISEMKKICAENPNDIESQKALAELYFKYNNFEDSLDLVQNVFTANMKEGTWVKNFVSQILQKNPRHIPSYYFLSHVFLKEGEYSKAIDVSQKLVEMVPTEITNVIARLEDIKERNSELLLYLSSLRKDVGDIDKAIVTLNELFTFDSSFNDAIALQIKEILKKNSNVGDAYLLAHKIFVHQKEYERAVEAIKQAQKLMPRNYDLVLMEGQTYYEMGEPEKAIKLYTQLLDKVKDRKAIYRLIRKTRQQHFSERIDMIKGDSDNDRLERAALYLIMNKLAKASKELKFVPRDRFASRRHTLLRARLFVKEGRPIDALEVMKDLPVDEETAPVYAEIYENMGSYEAAAVVLRQAGVEGVQQKIASYEKLAQERRLSKGRYFIEGRS